MLAYAKDAPSATRQPNILFLFCDDWGRYGGMYEDAGHPSYRGIAKTPTLDRLAQQGVVFENAFMPVPSCTPCRGSIITGRYFWRNGRAAFLGGGDWGPKPGLWESIPKFPNILEYLGYHIGFTGKIGVDWWESEVKMRQPHQHYSKNGRRFMEFSQHVSGKPDIEAAKQEIYDEVVANFRDFIKDRKDPDQPFFYWFGPYNVHRSWIRGSGKELWGIDPDDFKGKLPPAWPDVHEIREDLADYLGELAAFDAMSQALLEELREMGELGNTMIVATGDNGIPGFPRAKRNLYDLGVAAPLIVNWKGFVKRNRRVTDFVNLMDLAPTFIEAAGGTPPASMDGVSLIPVLGTLDSGQIQPERDHVIIGRERHVRPYPMRGIRTKDYLYIVNYRLENRPDILDGPPPAETPNVGAQSDSGPTKTFMIAHYDDPEVWPLFKQAFDRRPVEELYDLRNDPSQMNNIADHVEYANIKASLKNRLMAVMEAGDDDRIHPGETIYDKPPYIEADPARRGKW